MQGGAAGGPSVRRASARALTRHAHEVALRGIAKPNMFNNTPSSARECIWQGRRAVLARKKIHVTLKPHGRYFVLPPQEAETLMTHTATSSTRKKQARAEALHTGSCTGKLKNHSFSRCHHLRCEHRPGVRRQREQTADAPLVANPSLPHADGQAPWQMQGCASGHAVHAQGPRRLLGCMLHQGAAGPRRFKTRSGAGPTVHTRCL